MSIRHNLSDWWIKFLRKQTSNKSHRTFLNTYKRMRILNENFTGCFFFFLLNFIFSIQINRETNRYIFLIFQFFLLVIKKFILIILTIWYLVFQFFVNNLYRNKYILILTAQKSHTIIQEQWTMILQSNFNIFHNQPLFYY